MLSLLCGGMWKGGVAGEEALGSPLWGASAVSQWLFLTAVEMLLFVTLQGPRMGPGIVFSLSAPSLVSAVSSLELASDQLLLLCPVSGDCIRLCCC